MLHPERKLKYRKLPSIVGVDSYNRLFGSLVTKLVQLTFPLLRTTVNVTVKLQSTVLCKEKKSSTVQWISLPFLLLFSHIVTKIFSLLSEWDIC